MPRGAEDARAGAFAFGQFLVDQAALDSAAIRRALDLMESENRTLGALAAAQGLMSGYDAERVAHIHMQSDRAFGEVAVELGLLTNEQVKTLLAEQASKILDLRGALLRLDLLDESSIEALEARFDAEVGIPDFEPIEIPEALRGDRVAARILEVLPGHLRRVAQVEVRLQPDKDGGGSGPVKACLTMRGNPGAKITLATELELARKIACGMLGFAADEMDDDLIEDGLAEFLNVVSGRVVQLLRSEGTDLQIDPPEPGLADLSGVPFRIESLRGNGALYIRRTND